MSDFRRLFPTDACLDMICMDQLIEARAYPEVRQAIDRVCRVCEVRRLPEMEGRQGSQEPLILRAADWDIDYNSKPWASCPALEFRSRGSSRGTNRASRTC